jgi:FG-GAP-like repeat
MSKSSSCLLTILFIVDLLLTPAMAQSGEDKVWLQTTFEDFQKGRLVDGGNNLYISRSGSIETVNRWDLNGDGYIDLIFNNSHDEWQTVPVYLYLNSKERGLDAGSRIELPADGGSKALVRDLNHDGYPELVIANTFNGTTMRLNAYIYWGSSAGYSPSRRTELPTLGARRVVVGDFNRDGFLDLAFAQQGDVADNPRAGYGSVDNRTSYVYWGGKDGYTMHGRQALETIAATDAAVADFDGDGYDDLIILNNSVDSPNDLVLFRGGRAGLTEATQFGGKKLAFVRTGDVNSDGRPDVIVGCKEANAIRLYLGSVLGITREAALVLPVREPQDAAVDDLNRDGRADLVVAAGGPGEGASYIYFSGQKGLSEGSRISLPTTGALGCTIADLNADGYKDVVFANSVDEESYSTESYIYWNGPDGFRANHRQALPTIGASDVIAADVDGNKTSDLLFVGFMGGRRKSDVNAFIYMSDPSDRQNLYKVQNRLELPTMYGYESSVADLNDDGYPDLVLANLASRDPTHNPGSYIYWGDKNGYSPLRRTSLDTDMGGWSSCVADFNRDGFLDVLFTQLKSGTNLIFYGTQGGSGHELRKAFRDSEAGDARTAAVGDLNRDGYLDIIIPYVNSPWVDIFWGAADGDYGPERMTRLPSMATVSVEIADLNQDGWLDLVLCNFWDTETLSHQINSYIYWGSPNGYSPFNRQELPNGAAHDASVADVNNDGYLDVVFSNYHRDQLRHGIPSYAYLGSNEGFFRRENRLELINDSAAGNLIADLNHDGYLDIVFSNHTLWGRHDNARSRIFWGSFQGYNNVNVTPLPTVGPHQMSSTDVGNIYTRKLEEYFESEPFDMGPTGQVRRIEWDADAPKGSSVKMQVRTAATRAELTSGSWLGWDGPETFYSLSGESIRGSRRGDRWIQYRATLGSDYGARWPVLREVRIIYFQ